MNKESQGRYEAYYFCNLIENTHFALRDIATAGVANEAGKYGFVTWYPRSRPRGPSPVRSVKFDPTAFQSAPSNNTLPPPVERDKFPHKSVIALAPHIEAHANQVIACDLDLVIIVAF